MNSHHRDLFKWQRRATESRQTTTHQKQKDSVNSWIKKVQRDSAQAAQDAYGTSILHEELCNNLIPDDEAVYEAQSLIDGWLKEKEFPDLHRELEFRNISTTPTSSKVNLILDSRETQLASQKESDTDKYLDGFRKKYLDYQDYSDYDNNVEYKLDNPTGFDANHASKSDNYTELVLQNMDSMEDIDDSLLVQEVMNHMLSKPVKKVDLGLKPLSKKIKDPLPKMNLRHEQVSGNHPGSVYLNCMWRWMLSKDVDVKIQVHFVPEFRRQRLKMFCIHYYQSSRKGRGALQVKEKGKQRREKHRAVLEERMLKKEVQHKAREKIMLEEKAKQTLQKKEERAIQQEMAKIRKEIDEEKKLRLKEEERKLKILEEAKQNMQAELQKQKEAKRHEEQRVREMEDQMRIELEEEIQRNTIEEMKIKMKILHKHFSAWYDLVLQRRLNTGKALVLLDWKRKLKAWRAWKAYVSHVKTNQAAKQMEELMKERCRREKMAIDHHQRKLKRLCLSNWLKYARYKSEKKLLNLEREKTQRMMAMFLKTASEKINNNNGDDKNDKGVKIQEKVVKKSNNKKEMNNNKYKKEIQEMKEQLQLEQKQAEARRKTPREEKESANYPVKTSGNASNTINTETCLLGRQMNHKQNDDEFHLALPHSSRSTNSSNSSTSRSTGPKTVSTSRVVGPSNQSTSRSTGSTNSLKSQKFSHRSEKETTKPLRLAMEEREQQRRERKQQIDEQKRKKEEDKLEALREKETLRLQKEEQEKEEKLRKRKEEKRLAAEKEREKQLRLDAIRLKTECAKRHYSKHLLLTYGFHPLQKLVQLKRLNEQIAEKHISKKILTLVFFEWFEYTRNTNETRHKMADACYERILLKRSLRSWQKVRFNLQNQNKLARKYNLRRILRRTFHIWQDYVTDERILMWAKESTADDHNLIRLQKTTLNLWKTFIADAKEERKREVRRNELRSKVQQWLPDFQRGIQSSSST